jgi:putative spermidine/putrescine transport system ATP-binding protein
LHATLVALRDDGWAEVRVGDQLLLGRVAGNPAPGAAIEIALRAERIRLGVPGTAGATCFDAPVLEAEVREVIFEGDRLVYGLHVPALGGARLLVFDHDRGARAMAAGEQVGVTWQPADLMIFPRENT